MNRPTHLCAALVLLALALASGCGGETSNINPPPVPQSTQVSVSMTDTPPVGVTILSFEVSLTGAALNPGNVDLLAGRTPIRIEVERLQTEAVFLSTANVTAGTYANLMLTFANPELTFLNGTGATLAGCAAGAVCQIKPTGTLTSTINFPTPGLSVTAGSPTGLLVDVNLNTLLSSTLGVDFSAFGAATVQQLPLPGQPFGQLEEIEDLTGIVGNKDAANNQFTLQTTSHGNFTVKVDNNTQFQDFAACAANNFTCVQNGQAVEVDLRLMAGGTLLAKKIELEDDVNEAVDDEVEGIVFKIDGATQFEMVVTDELRDVANVSVGDPVIVTLQNNISFRVDTNGLTVPASLQQAFEGATDTLRLVVGQGVQVRKRSLSAGPPITIATDRVRLRMTRFTAIVSGAPSGFNFNVGGLPGLFTGAGINQIQVQTSSQTEFEGVSGVSGLADGTRVSLRGLLFQSSPDAVLIADKVRKR